MAANRPSRRARPKDKVGLRRHNIIISMATGVLSVI